jgi:calcineurin-like phosphoesterase family protein
MEKANVNDDGTLDVNTRPDLKSIWVCSDLHFLHDNLIDYCGRPDDHSNKIFKNLMAIPEGDLLICLGDLSIGREADVYEWFIKPLKCRKILVKGNHDRKSNTWYLNHGWDFVCYSFIDTYFGKRIVFSHYPIPYKDCDYNFHGHLHNNVYKYDHLTDENKAFISDRHILINCEDNGYRPLKLNYVIDEIEKFKLINRFKEK